MTLILTVANRYGTCQSSDYQLTNRETDEPISEDLGSKQLQATFEELHIQLAFTGIAAIGAGRKRTIDWLARELKDLPYKSNLHDICNSLARQCAAMIRPDDRKGVLELILTVAEVGKPFRVAVISNADWSKCPAEAKPQFSTRVKKITKPFRLITGYRAAVPTSERRRLRILSRRLGRSSVDILQALGEINSNAAKHSRGYISEKCWVTSQVSDGDVRRSASVNIGEQRGIMSRVQGGFDVTEFIRKEVGSNSIIRQSAVALYGPSVGTLPGPTAPISTHDQTVESLRELTDQGKHRELRHHLAGALRNRGLALRILNRLPEAIHDNAKSIALFRVLVEKEDRRELRNGLASVFMNQGVALTQLGRLPEAIDAHNNAISIRRLLVEKEHQGELRKNLAMSLMNFGNSLWRWGRLDDAITASAEAISIYRALVEEEGCTALRGEFAMALMNQGIVLGETNRLREAITAYSQSVSVYRILVDEEGRTEFRKDLAMALMNQGTVFEMLDRPKEALANHDLAVSICRALVSLENRRELRDDLAAALMNRGTVLDRLGRVKEAVETYQESIAILRELVEREARSDARNDLAKALHNLGSAVIRLGRLDEAIRACDDSILIRRQLVEGEYRDDLRPELATTWNSLAIIQEMGKNLPAACQAARQARQLWDEMMIAGIKDLERAAESARALEARLCGSVG